MIVFDDVHKSYPVRGGGRTTVLDGFSGTIRPRVNVGILGRNGAGKSTLMRLISGGERPTRGAIYREGTVSWPLGFAGGFNGSLSGRQNLRFIARLYDADYEEVSDFVEDFAEIGRFFDAPLKTYSAGMRARLAFGAAMAMQFDYYLIDEVIGVGDANFQRKCREVFEARAERATLLLVSHVPRLLQQFCDIGGVLQDGRLTFYDTLDEAMDVHAENQERAGTTMFA